jgi:hypothetical protein
MRYAAGMETIYDFDPTPEELRYLGSREGRAHYEASATADEINIGLTQLFAMRGDRARADHYQALIQDRDFVRFDLCYADLKSDSRAEKSAADPVAASSAA